MSLGVVLCIHCYSKGCDLHGIQ